MYTDDVVWPVIEFETKLELEMQYVAVGKNLWSHRSHTRRCQEKVSSREKNKKMSQRRPSQKCLMGSALKPDCRKERTFVIDSEASGVNGLIRLQMEPHLMGHTDDRVRH